MSHTHQFEAFMQAYQNMVYTTAARLLGNETDAQDIAQEVFLKAYERFADLGQSPTVGGWLKTVTTNLCLNHLSRYRSRWRFFSEMRPRDDETDFVEDLPAPDTAKTDSENADHRRILEAALQKLPPAQRVPLVLFHFEGLSYEEVAARLKVSLSKVKTDIHRGRGALRRKLAFDPSGESLCGSGPPAAVANPSLTPCRPAGKEFTEAP
jgi:RNA polymerase sigma-70 factor (ECF subfamily)